MKRLRSASGQVAAEYLGALLVVSAIIAVLVLTDTGERIGYRMQVLVCKIAAAQDCGRAGVDRDEPELAQCVVDSSDRSIEGSVKVLIFKAEGGIEGSMEIAADGTTTVTVKGKAGGGLEFSMPGVQAGDGSTQASSPKGEFSVTGEGQFARSWKFDSKAEADDFIQHMVDKLVAQADLIPNFLQGADDYDPPPQDSDEVYGGVSVEASASAGGGGAYASAEGGIAAGVGAKYLANGDTTYYFKAKASASGKAGYAFTGGFGAGGDGEVLIGITYDEKGNEKTMTVSGVGSVSAGLDFSGGAEDLDTVMKGIEKASFAGGAQQGQRVELQSELDLTDPRNRAAARAFLDGRNADTGRPVPLDQATAELYDRFNEDGMTNVRLYDLDQTEAGIDVDGTVIGFSLKYAAHDAHLRDAWYDPGQGPIEHWFRCADAAAPT